MSEDLSGYLDNSKQEEMVEYSAVLAKFAWRGSIGNLLAWQALASTEVTRIP